AQTPLACPNLDGVPVEPCHARRRARPDTVIRYRHAPHPPCRDVDLSERVARERGAIGPLHRQNSRTDEDRAAIRGPCCGNLRQVRRIPQGARRRALDVQNEQLLQLLPPIPLATSLDEKIEKP